MKTILTILVWSVWFNLSAQNELNNTQLEETVMHGGTSMSGVSTTLRYHLFAEKTVTFKHIQFNQKKLTLKKGELLFLSLTTYKPYVSIPEVDLDSIILQRNIDSQNLRIKADTSQGNYYANIHDPKHLSLSLTYFYKKEEFVAKVKTQADSSVRHFAP
jgi:hypothetical protein